MIQNEVAILRRVKHPNIVLLIEEVDTYNELYLVMELVKVCLRHIMFDVLKSLVKVIRHFHILTHSFPKPLRNEANTLVFKKEKILHFNCLFQFSLYQLYTSRS